MLLVGIGKTNKFNDLGEYLVFQVIACNTYMVPGAGIEPARYFYRGILSPLRLPISPPGHSFKLPGEI